MTDDMSTKPTDEVSGSSERDTADTTVAEPDTGGETGAGGETAPVSEGETSENADAAESPTATEETPSAGADEGPAGADEPATAGAHEPEAAGAEEPAPAGADEVGAAGADEPEAAETEGGAAAAAADPDAASPTEGPASGAEGAATGVEAPAAAAVSATGAVGATGAAAASASGPAAQAQIFESGYKPPPGTTGSSRIGRIARSTVAVILIVLGVLCLTLSPVVIWGRNLILNTNRYVETLQPIAHNPGVQNAVVTAVEKQVNTNVDVSQLLDQTNLTPRVKSAIGPALQSGLSNLVDSVVTKFVQSKAFVTLWVTINRTAHTQLVYFLTGSRQSGLKVNNQGELVLDLSPVVTSVKKQLVSAGLTVANHVPAVGATIEIAQVKGVEKVRSLIRFLNTLADWLPWIGLALLAAGIATARRHRRTFIISMIGVVAGMIVLGIGLLIGRHLFQNGLPPDVLPTSTAGQVYDTVVRFVREGIRIVAVVALLLALIAWVLGPSSYAVTVRGWLKTGYRWTIDRIGRGSVGDFIGAHTMPITWATVGVGLFLFLLLGLGSLAAIITIVVIFAVLVLLIQAIGLTNARYRETASGPSAAAG
jgi:hypothetical protein